MHHRFTVPLKESRATGAVSCSSSQCWEVLVQGGLLDASGADNITVFRRWGFSMFCGLSNDLENGENWWVPSNGGGLTPEISDRGVLLTLCRPPTKGSALLVSGWPGVSR